MSDELRYVFCPTCERTQLAERPPCGDEHGDDCPDRACVECGTALFDGATRTGSATRDARRRGAA